MKNKDSGDVEEEEGKELRSVESVLLVAVGAVSCFRPSSREECRWDNRAAGKSLSGAIDTLFLCVCTVWR